MADVIVRGTTPSLIVDWRNNRIGIRCVNAPTGRQDLVYINHVYGVL